MIWLRRLVAVALILLSVGTGGRLIWTVMQDPLWQPFEAAAEDQVRAALDRELADQASPERVAALIEGHLGQTPRNWAALDSLQALALARGIGLPMGLQEAYDQAKAEDESWTAQASACAVCAWDVALCPLDGTLICQGVVALTPLPDVAGVSRAAGNWLAGEEIDRFDLTLSVVGLTATAAVLVTGGGSEAVKAGAGVLRMAKGMGRLSGRLMDWVLAVSARAIDMRALARGEVLGAVRLAELAPLVKMTGHLADIRKASDFGTMMHLLPLIDDAEDAAKLARASKAMGKEVVASAEILGKARLLRATLRWSEALIRLTSGALALVAGLAHGLGQALWALTRRGLRRIA